MVDENGQAQQGAMFYVQGQPITDEIGALVESDKAGLLRLPDLATNQLVLALLKVGHGDTSRLAHPDGAYQVFQTNLNLDDGGQPRPEKIGSSGLQQITLRKTDPLILFNIVVSIEWDADEVYLASIEDAFIKASDYLYDISDGQMAFVKSPDGISIELLQAGDALQAAEPWSSMENTGTW